MVGSSKIYDKMQKHLSKNVMSEATYKTHLRLKWKNISEILSPSETISNTSTVIIYLYSKILQ